MSAKTGRALTSLVLAMSLAGVATAYPAPAAGYSPVPDRNGNGRFDAGDDAEAWEERSRILGQLVNSKGALGSYVTDDGTVVVVVPASGSSSFSAADAKELGFDVRLKPAPLEPDDIAKITDAAIDYAKSHSVGLTIDFDAEVGRLIVGSDGDNAAAEFLEGMYPDKVIAWPNTTRGGFASRRADYNPHWGGAQMRNAPPHPPGGFDCTSGFAVLNVNGNRRMVTAGHCFDLGETINSPGGHSFGIVKRVEFGGDPLNMDSALVGGSGSTHEGIIYVGACSSGSGYDTCVANTSTSLPVVGAGDPAVTSSLMYCVSGGRRGELCGQEARV